ncbi:MAG: OmpA family protein [Sulfuricellaceae bacterium]|nr:OmpA family protein [Sulfuricellaceae bacterium]
MKPAVISKITLGLIVAAFSGAALANSHTTKNQGYWTDAQGTVWKNSYNECWKDAQWTPAMAIEECDPVAKAPEAPKKAEAAKPAPAGPEKVAFEKVTLQAETLFDFNKATLRAEGKTKLNSDVVAKMKQYPQVEVVMVTGHADRIGKDAYNQNLSERRAAAVKDYLVSQGVESSRLQTAGKGEAEPVAACSDVKGKESGKNKKLVECLQPNRRVMVEVIVQKPTK